MLILFATAFNPFEKSSILKKVNLADVHMQLIALALNSYAIDNCGCPPMSHANELNDTTTQYRLPQAPGLPELTTPFAYIKRLPEDPFHSTPSGDFHYEMNQFCDYLLSSNGPDGKKILIYIMTFQLLIMGL